MWGIKMKYTSVFLKILVSCCLMLSVASVVLAGSADPAPLGVVNPVNAVIATVLVILAGVLIYIRRHREN